ncbi:MAG: toprim domain-containing protein, partial [Alistipes sp.]|nr:toprim domain-containing protein [Alistipes sp.]
TDATIQKFGLGFCPSRGDRMSKDALAAGYKKEFLLSTGLSKERESDQSLYDRFRDRVIFPVHNISGRVVAFGAHTLRSDKEVAKYLNSPESEIYSKKNELYGLYFAKRAIQQQDCAIMVEGYLDVISMHQAGVENVVASSGTSLTTEQIRLLGRFTRNMTVIYDGDSAGIKASLRGIDMILKEGMNVRVVSLPEGEDPDTFARGRSSEELQRYIRDHEQDFLDFKAHLLLDEAQGDPIRKASLITDMVQSIAQIPDSIQRSVYIKECARTMDIDEQILIGEVARKRMATTGDREADDFVRRQMARQRREEGQAPMSQAGETEFRARIEVGSSVDALERELVRDLLKYGHRFFDFKEGKNMVACNVAEVIFGELDADNLHFTDERYNQILETYRAEWQRLGTGVEVSHDHFVSHVNPDVCNIAVDILMADDNYVPSELWRRKEVHIESEEEMLANGVPKAVTLYKSKVVERLIREEQQKLASGALSEAEEESILRHLSQLNSIKVTIANRLQRMIL